MVTLQFYKHDGDARIFDKDKTLVDLNNYNKLTKSKIDKILEKLNIKRTKWIKTDWGYECNLKTIR